MQAKAVVVISTVAVSVSLASVELDAEEAINHRGELEEVRRLLEETQSYVYDKVSKMNLIERKNFGI